MGLSDISPLAHSILVKKKRKKQQQVLSCYSESPPQASGPNLK